MANARALLALNTVYFAAAAVAAFYIVYEAFHYGFFLWPFPTVLTLAALLFSTAAFLGLRHLTVRDPLPGQSTANLRPSERRIRIVSLVLPLFLFGYAGLKYYVEQGGGYENFAAGRAYVFAERCLFGFKRADDRCVQFATRLRAEQQYLLARAYIWQAIQHGCAATILGIEDQVAVKHRMHDRCIDGMRITEEELRVTGKSPALPYAYMSLF